MKKITKILTIIIVLFVSCDSKNVKDKTLVISDSTVTTDSTLKMQKDTLEIIGKIEPEVFLFKYSECKENCNDYERIISKKYKGDTLLLKIGSIQNCYGKFRLEIDKNDKELNLDIKILEEIVKRKSGKVDTIVTMLDCECYYYFDIGIKHIEQEFKTILINGNKFGRKQKGHIEINEKQE